MGHKKKFRPLENDDEESTETQSTKNNGSVKTTKTTGTIIAGSDADNDKSRFRCPNFINPISIIILIILILCIICIIFDSIAIQHDVNWNALVKGDRKIDFNSSCPYFDSRTFNLSDTKQALMKDQLIRRSYRDITYVVLNSIYFVGTSVFLIMYCVSNQFVRFSYKGGTLLVIVWFIFSFIFHVICFCILIVVITRTYDRRYAIAAEQIMLHELQFYKISKEHSGANFLVGISRGRTWRREAFEKELITPRTGVTWGVANKIHEQCQALRQILVLCTETKPLSFSDLPDWLLPRDVLPNHVVIKGQNCTTGQFEELGFCQLTSAKIVAAILTVIICLLCLTLTGLAGCVHYEERDEEKELLAAKKSLQVDAYDGVAYQDEVYDESNLPIYPNLDKRRKTKKVYPSSTDAENDSSSNNRNENRNVEYLQIGFSDYPCEL